MGSKGFELAVGMSQSWDPSEAGREVVRETLKKVKHKPRFFLLFSTIHFEKEEGGMEKFVEAAYRELPKGTPMIGGTVAGFMSREGCFTRGSAGLACFAPKMDVAIAEGRDTKRSPKAAALQVSKSIRRELSTSRYPNKAFIAVISGARVPNWKGIPRQKVVKDSKKIRFLLKIFETLSSKLQIGPSRDDVIFKEVSRNLKDFVGIGGASTDDLSQEKNFQFFNGKLRKNSIVVLGISSDIEIRPNSSLGLKPSGKRFDITKKSKKGYIIFEIDKKPAVERYLEIMGWDKSILDERLYRKVFYYPMLPAKKGIKEPRMFGLIYGDAFVFPMSPTTDKDLEIYTSSGKDLLESIEKLLEKRGEAESAFMVSCGTRLETMGSRIFDINQRIKERLKGDYLLIYTAGEYIKEREKEGLTLYQSDNALFLDGP